MASEKTVNYTADQTAQLVKGYLEGVSVEKLAEMVGHSTRSVIAKLSREKVYVPKTATKAEKALTKAEMVLAVEAELGLEKGALESLEKGSKEALSALMQAVKAAEVDE